ncbi:MAG: ParB/RepB/Spo0J family partition protein [Oscillospiraceae bacterium]|nr:ParB/RepB/Spo0J family partition protein [Oscillospiraceae bacterium]
MAKKTGLGNGIAALFADNSIDMTIDNRDITVMRTTHIEPKKTQPRKDFNKEALAELADSIAKHGIIQPIVVRSQPNGYYQIIAGERRWRAAKMAGLDEVPVVIKNVDDLTATEMTMVENLQREDLNPIEEAMGYKYLADHYDMTQEEISRQVAKSRSVVANALRLLSLPDEILKYIESNELSAGHARALLAIDSPDEQVMISQRIIKNDLSVRDTEKIVKMRKSSSLESVFESSDEDIRERNDSENAKSQEAVYIKNLQQKISEVFGRKVVINKAKKQGANHGKLEIEYKDNDELESIIKVLCGENIFEENEI